MFDNDWFFQNWAQSAEPEWEYGFMLLAPHVNAYEPMSLPGPEVAAVLAKDAGVVVRRPVGNWEQA